jgi:hypothetical protein
MELLPLIACLVAGLLGALLVAGAVLLAARWLREAVRDLAEAIRTRPAPTSPVIHVPAPGIDPATLERLDRLEQVLSAVDERLHALQCDMAARSAAPASPRRGRSEEIRSLLARGRNPVEIAQLLDADVGEIELVLQLDSAARQRGRA